MNRLFPESHVCDSRLERKLEKMKDKEDKLIQDFNENLSGEIAIRVITGRDEQGESINAFCSKLSMLAPKVRIAFEEDPNCGRSCIRIFENLAYHAVPSGTELEPFLLGLAILDGKKPVITPRIREQLDGLRTPAYLRLYVTPQCPHCPVAARDLIALAAASPLVHLTVVDAALFSDMAQADAVQSAPTLILNNRLRWGGSTYFKEVVEVMTCSDPSRLSLPALESLLHEGGASQVTRLILETEKAIPRFSDLLIHESWSVRLAAMVVMEELIEKEISVAAACLSPLGNRLSELDDQVKGDIVYLAGKAGGKEWLPLLYDLLKQEKDLELTEATLEAINSIRTEKR
ncbi:MAG: thioredoxin family protein [Planctomycetota bacterium]